jgi:hypothetical protein
MGSACGVPDSGAMVKLSVGGMERGSESDRAVYGPAQRQQLLSQLGQGLPVFTTHHS